jgi:hypothetical protein
MKNFHFFALYTKAHKLVKAVIRHLPGNTSAKNITVVLQEIDYDVISVKLMTAKRVTPEGGWVIHTSITLFLVTLAWGQKASEIFKLARLGNILMNVEAYRSHNGLQL